MQKQIRLTELRLNLNRYGDNVGKYTGSLEYENQSQKTTLTLDPAISEQILGFIGPVINEAAKAVAAEAAQAIQTSLEALKPAMQIEEGGTGEAV